MKHLIAEVERGGRTESRHFGHIAIVDASNRPLAHLGDTETPVFPRSTVKPLLALPFVESGAAERLQLSEAELAVICASHNGEERHTQTVEKILHRAHQKVTCLECGAHWPLYDNAARKLAGSGNQPSALHNNCSGKHAALVCLALDQGMDPRGYIVPDHPVQKQVTATLAALTDTPHNAANRGIDGCSMPTYAVPLRQLALGFARFVTGQGLSPSQGAAARTLREAVAADPFMIAGSERFDTRLMSHFGSRVFCKMGAEGVMVAALPGDGVGIAIKTEDGANRAAEVALAGLLKQKFGTLWSEEDHSFLSSMTSYDLKNWNGIKVGRVRAPARIVS